jgi:hypothetical protein
MSDIDDANANPVDSELMKQMLEFLETVPIGQRGNMSDRTMELLGFLEQKLSNLETLARAAILISFEIRMEALFRLRRRPEYRAWAIAAVKKRGPDFIHEILIETAASEPLSQRNNRPAFNPVSFFRRALERTQPAGSA